MEAIEKRWIRELLKAGYPPARLLKAAGVSLQQICDEAAVSYTLVHKEVYRELGPASRGEGINAVRAAINKALGFDVWTFAEEAGGVVASFPAEL